MPRRRVETSADRYRAGLEELAKREHEVAGLRDAAAREIGLIVLESGGAKLSPATLRVVVERVALMGEAAALKALGA